MVLEEQNQDVPAFLIRMVQKLDLSQKMNVLAVQMIIYLGSVKCDWSIILSFHLVKCDWPFPVTVVKYEWSITIPRVMCALQPQ